MRPTKLDLLFTAVINIATIIANALGIRWLALGRRPYANQIKIVANISFVDICISVLNFCTSIAYFAATTALFDKFYNNVNIVRTSLYLTWFFMFYLMMLDRFLGCCFPLWYRAYNSPKWIRNGIGICWLLTIVSAPTMLLIAPSEIVLTKSVYLFLPLSTIYLVQFAVLYCAVFFIKRRSTARTGRQVNRADNRRFFAVTTAMLVAFLVLEAIPSFAIYVMILLGFSNLELYLSYFRPLWDLNLLVDPIIYIFMRPNAGRELFSWFGAFFRCFRRDASARGDSRNQNRVAQLETGI